MLNVLLKTTRRYSELIFESVRASQFPDLPSRQTCIYLCEFRDVDKWYSAISPDGKAGIYEFQATGSLHKADQRFVQDADILPHGNFLKNASGYWNGEQYAEDTTWGILFVGKLEVTRRFNNLEMFRDVFDNESESSGTRLSG